MEKIRRFLWKNLGITLDRQTLLITGIVVLSFTVAIVFRLLANITTNSLFRLLFLITILPGGIIVMGSSYRLIEWNLSDKEGREEIEREVALGQLKRRVNDKNFKR